MASIRYQICNPVFAFSLGFVHSFICSAEQQPLVDRTVRYQTRHAEIHCYPEDFFMIVVRQFPYIESDTFRQRYRTIQIGGGKYDGKFSTTDTGHQVSTAPDVLL